MFRVGFAPTLRSTTAVYSHKCVYGFGTLVSWSRYWFGHPHTFSKVNIKLYDFVLLEGQKINKIKTVKNSIAIKLQTRILLSMLHFVPDIPFPCC
jgi:hypothetical protein